MILTLAIGSAILGAAFLAADDSERARRVWTPMLADGELKCVVCGCHPADHLVPTDVAATAACPRTADSLTTEQILRWHRNGGPLIDALTASDELRINLRSIGLRFPMPSNEETNDARAQIAAELNEQETNDRALSARLSDR